MIGFQYLMLFETRFHLKRMIIRLKFNPEISLQQDNNECPNGHTLCTNCKRIHNYCPNCRSELGNIRCLALEKVAESLQFPCKYQNLGYRDLFPYYNKLKHEQRCSFRPYICPCASSECSVTGDVPYLVAKSMCMTGALSTTDTSSQIPMKSKVLHGCSL
ncbi:hypothetical protein RD792_000319 [Penstemon davidsonii]|uniref:SIAH-type domain-containing protein n=1 Tax=Penstemon davidsonii TaxID=160366 RepID=A0ABR0DLF3_9LAMI|nr:hypothetical protein RD792_000319 [Penstemon davidsonii]